MKFGFITDLHLTGKNITSRLDNYADTILNKIEQCYDYAVKNNFDFMINGGDVFNTHKIYSYDIILRFVDIMKKSKLPTYFIVGNHDVYGLSFNYFEKSTLYFVSKICDNFQFIDDKLKIGNIVFYSCHTWNNPEFCLKQSHSEDDGCFKVLLMHHLLDHCNPDNVYTNLDTSKFGELDYDLVLSGDLHCGFNLHNFGKTNYYNPGSLSRTSKANIGRKPKMAVIEVNGNEFNKTDYYPNIIPGKNVFKEDLFIGIEEENVSEDINLCDDTKELIDEFNLIKSKSSDIYSLITAYGNKEGVSQEVIDYIYKFKK